jgi:hypothetical protein
MYRHCTHDSMDRPAPCGKHGKTFVGAGFGAFLTRHPRSNQTSSPLLPAAPPVLSLALYQIARRAAGGHSPALARSTFGPTASVTSVRQPYRQLTSRAGGLVWSSWLLKVWRGECPPCRTRTLCALPAPTPLHATARPRVCSACVVTLSCHPRRPPSPDTDRHRTRTEGTANRTPGRLRRSHRTPDPLARLTSGPAHPFPRRANANSAVDQCVVV